jgi:hypothetical protein
MSCSRDDDFIAEAAQRVNVLEQQLLSWRKVLRDFPEQPTFADLRFVVRDGTNTFVGWFNEEGRAYDIQESFDGASWYPFAYNLVGDLWFGPTTAVYFRIIKRPYVIVSCDLPHSFEVPDTRFLAEVLGPAGGCYDSTAPSEDIVSCPEPL